MLRKVAFVSVGLVVALVLGVYSAGRGSLGSHEPPGVVTERLRPAHAVAAARARVAGAARAIGAPPARQVLFGDLHVHTTFSLDAFLISLPFVGGEGAHPPADACDFARFCSALDFWSITDHAEAIAPEHWRETVDSIRQCNALSGKTASPDTVAFLGWEWTQVGRTPEEHFGHKNVILHYTDADRIPARPIAAAGRFAVGPSVLRRGIFALMGGGRVHDLARHLSEVAATERCDPDAKERDLPVDCLESAATPEDLYRKLDDWGHDAVVIPHGTTWGFYSPPGSSFDKQLSRGMHDPNRQTLIEVYSGHGSSEVYRSFRGVEFAADGSPICPEPSPDYLPTCWQAGEIIRTRCEKEGEAAQECARRAAEARRNAMAAGVAGHRTVPGAKLEDWLDAGQCRDCRQPAFNYRPAGSVQYILALGNFDSGDAEARRFRLGLIASSDNHFARPGTGYKEQYRRGMTESLGGSNAAPGPLADLLQPPAEEPSAESRPFDWKNPGLQIVETERQGSFFSTGGLVAMHAEGRDRDAIWDALERREVYGTSGPRILLWFDLLNPPSSAGRSLPMGGEVRMATNPIFQVRAVGSFEQLPGCPDYTTRALPAQRIEHLCKGECYNPSDRRRLVTRIEVVRIRPQLREDEDVAGLIDDPWRSFVCDPDPAGCAVTFEDPDFSAAERDSLYYVRVFEAPTPAINADTLRCDRDADGSCIRVNPCPDPENENEDCLGPHEPRAWSSPIFVDYRADGNETPGRGGAPDA